MLCSPCTIYDAISVSLAHVFPFVHFRAVAVVFLYEEDISAFACAVVHISVIFSLFYFMYIYIIFPPSSFPFNPLTRKVAILSFSGASPGYPSVYPSTIEYFLRFSLDMFFFSLSLLLHVHVSMWVCSVYCSLRLHGYRSLRCFDSSRCLVEP